MRRQLFLSFGAGFVAVATVVLCLGALAQDDAAEARVSIQRLRLDGARVLLTFELHHVFDETFRRRLESGLPTGFLFELRLVRARKTWFDSAVEAGRLQVDAMYNAVTREYLINYRHNGNLIESRVIRDLDEVRQAMTTFTELPVFTVPASLAGQRLQVRLRAELGTGTVLFFIPRTINTDWVVTRRFQIAGRGEASGGSP